MNKIINDFIVPYSFEADILWYSEYYRRYVLPIIGNYVRNKTTLQERDTRIY